MPESHPHLSRARRRPYVGGHLVALAGAATVFGVTGSARRRGIEDRDQVAPLVGLGCELAQGYLFAKPASAAAVAELAGGAGVSRCRAVAAPRAATPAS